MSLKQYKPTSPGRRFKSTPDFSGLTRKKPEPALTKPLRKSGGRNSLGRTTVWFRGGGHKRRYRIVDFRRDKVGVPGRVAEIEYDPKRSANLALPLRREEGAFRLPVDRVFTLPGAGVVVTGGTSSLSR